MGTENLEYQLVKEIRSMRIGMDRTLPGDQSSVFHYTTIDGLCGMINSREIWVSHSEYLNDTSEGSYTHRLAMSVAEQDLKTNDVDEEFKALVLSLNNEQTELYFSLSEAYVFSTSLNEDSLFLWTYYTQGDGYNLELDFWVFTELIKGSKATLEFDYGRIVYQESEQRDIIKTDLVNIHRLWTNYRNQGSPEQHLNEEIRNALAWRIRYYSIFMKHPKFSNEEEFRFAFFPSSYGLDGQESHICHRIRNGLILPYMKIPIKVPVSKVRLGPMANSSDKVRGLRHFLNQHISIEQSSIPPIRH